MASEAKSLMQTKKEARKKFDRVIAVVLGLPALGIGIAVLWLLAYPEGDTVYLFFYSLLGLVLVLFGFYFIISGLPTKKARKNVIISAESQENIEDEKPETPEKVEPSKCPKCGAPIISAGKFCGNCGKTLP